MRELPGEAAGAERDNDFAQIRERTLHDVGGAGQNEVQAVIGCPGLRNHFVLAIGSEFAEATQTLDLECFQHRKHLISPCFNKGSEGCGHVIILVAETMPRPYSQPQGSTTPVVFQPSLWGSIALQLEQVTAAWCCRPRG